jgi:Matrixin
MKTIIIAAIMLVSGSWAEAYTLEGPSWLPGSVPFYLDLGAFNTVAVEKLAEWDKYMSGTTLTTTTNSRTNGSRYYFNDGRSSIVWSSSTGERMPNWILGATSLNWYTAGNGNGVLLESDIIINSDFTWSSYDGPSGNGWDIGRVLLHEIGHAIGLGHTSEYSIMRPSYSFQRWQLTADDIAGAQYLYHDTKSVPDWGDSGLLLLIGLSCLALRKI